MAEQFRSITEARKELPSLSQTVQGGAERFVITNKGRPQAVLLGYGEYQGLLAGVELLNRPGDLAHLQEGLAQTEQLSFEEVRENLRRRRGVYPATAATSAESPVESESMAIVATKLDEINGNLRRIMGTLAVTDAADPANPSVIVVRRAGNLSIESVRQDIAEEAEGRVSKMDRSSAAVFRTAER